MTSPADQELLDLLVARDGVPTSVTLISGKRLTVHNIAWGYDIGDEHAHVTTNISPLIPGEAIDYFVTNEVQSVGDPESRETLA